MQLIYILSVR